MSEFKRYTESCMQGGGVSKVDGLQRRLTLAQIAELAYAERLTAAEQRNAELVTLLEHAYGTIENSKEWRWLIDRIDAALKPTESGASE